MPDRIISVFCVPPITTAIVIYGIGTDIIDTERVKEQLDKVPGLREQLFTPLEIAYCLSKKYSEQHFAARLAAKEAFFKALGTGWRNGMAYRDIEVQNDTRGKPEIFLSGNSKSFIEENKVKRVHLSLAHLKALANAMVVLEY